MTISPLSAEAAAAIHTATLTLDTHVDIRWPDPPDPTAETAMRVDFPKMRRGGLKAAVFVAYTPQTRRDAQALAAAAARAEAMLHHIRGLGDGRERIFCSSAAALEAAVAGGALGILAAVENANALAGDLSRLQRWRALGAIYVTLTHDGHNDLGDSAQPKPELGDSPSEHGGLSPLGRAAIKAMNRLGLLVDVSHAAKATMLQAAEISRTPIIATHACCRALCDHPRNLDDEQLEVLRATGGMVQITALAAFLRPTSAGEHAAAELADLVDHVDYAVRRIGIEHVGLSSDFDGGGGIRGWADASQTANLTAALYQRGYGAREIALLWSGNFLRLLRKAEYMAETG